MTISKDNAYKEAGVDIDAGAELVKRISPHAKLTTRTGVMQGLGGFGACFDLAQTKFKDPILVAANDGVGTKLKIAIETNKHDTVGIDLVAMCVNDLIVQGAEPFFFLDYFATGKLDPAHAEQVIAGIADGCKQANCALIGGETAEMPGMYSGEDYDLAGFAVGAVERDKMITGQNIKPGDIMLGLRSAGTHSNGYSLIRKLVNGTQGYSYDSKAPFDSTSTMGEAFLTPTKIYVKSILSALKHEDNENKPMIKGMVHITGGGFLENIPRILPEGSSATLNAESWPLPPIFKWLADAGNLSSEDMCSTFNCGIGFIVICAPENADTLTQSLQENGETVFQIGTITDGNNTVQIENIQSAWNIKN